MTNWRELLDKHINESTNSLGNSQLESVLSPLEQRLVDMHDDVLVDQFQRAFADMYERQQDEAVDMLNRLLMEVSGEHFGHTKH